MTTRSVAPPPRPNTRELRALRLYEERGHEIVRAGPHTYEVPSCSGGGSYRVDLTDESCSCRDFEIRRENCMHILAASVKRAKRRGATARRLEALEDRVAHELMDEDGRCEVLDEIRALRRRCGGES